MTGVGDEDITAHANASYKRPTFSMLYWSMAICAGYGQCLTLPGAGDLAKLTDFDGFLLHLVALWHAGVSRNPVKRL